MIHTHAEATRVGLGLTRAESLGDSVASDDRRFTAGCPAAILAGRRNLGGGEVVSVSFKVEEDKPDFA